MVPRSWEDRRGAVHTAYYYEQPRDVDGKRPLLPLGTDLVKAKIEWAKLDQATHEKAQLTPDDFTVAAIYTRYMAWAEIPANSQLAARTIEDRKKYWKELSGPFGKSHIDALLPKHIVGYFDARSAKSSAKKELKFLSVLCSWARARGWMTAAHPCLGTIRLLKVDEGRDVYVSDALYWFVYAFCDRLVRECLDLALHCGLRPSEALRLKWADVRRGADGLEEIWIKLPKTTKSGVKIKRVRVAGELKVFLERIRTEHRVLGQTILCDEQGQHLTLQGKFRYRFDQARDAAGERLQQISAELGKDAMHELGLEWIRFQFRDMRPKAATDNERANGMDATRRLLGHTTEKQTADYVRGLVGELVDSVPVARMTEDFKEFLAKVLSPKTGTDAQ
jgi:integrase